MARAKSLEKRKVLIECAICEVDRAGLGASTTKIARASNLGEGTLFTYFETKTDLLNAVYIELKTEVYARINVAFPQDADLRTRVHHIWNESIVWAQDKPIHYRVLLLLFVSELQFATATTLAHNRDQSGSIEQTFCELATGGSFKELPPAFASSAMSAVQQAVLKAATTENLGKQAFEAGFEAFWRMAI